MIGPHAIVNACPVISERLRAPSIAKADRIMEQTQNQFGNISGLFVAKKPKIAVLFLFWLPPVSCDIRQNPIETAISATVGV